MRPDVTAPLGIRADELVERYRVTIAAIAELPHAADLADVELAIVALASVVAADPRLGLDVERRRLARRIAVDVVYTARLPPPGAGNRGAPRRRPLGRCHGFLSRLTRAGGPRGGGG